MLVRRQAWWWRQAWLGADVAVHVAKPGMPLRRHQKHCERFVEPMFIEESTGAGLTNQQNQLCIYLAI